MKKIRTILLTVFALHLFSAKAQKEFLVLVNPVTGTHTIIDSIPNVAGVAQNGSTYDQNNQRFIFLGSDRSWKTRLYTVDAVSGALLSSPVTTLNLMEPHYDNSIDKLYVIQNDNVNSLSFVSSVNLNTGASTIVDTLPFTGIALASTYLDEMNHTYNILSGNKLYSMNIVSGALSTVQFTTSFTCLTFDSFSGKAYGLHAGPPIVPVEINVSTGSYTALGTATLSMFNSTYRAYDRVNKIYTFYTNNKLNSISVTSGNIVSQPIFPQGLSGSQNVMELQFDYSNAKLYALHSGTGTVTGISERSLQESFDFMISPNPAQTSTNIHLDKNVKNIKVSLYNAVGELLLMKEEQNVNDVNLKLNELAKGIYFIKITADQVNLGTKRILVE